MTTPTKKEANSATQELYENMRAGPAFADLPPWEELSTTEKLTQTICCSLTIQLRNLELQMGVIQQFINEQELN